MRKNKNKLDKVKSVTIPAENWEASGGFALKPVQRPAVEGDKGDSIPTVPEKLHPTYPNPNRGFQPLSNYMVEKITKQIMKRMKRLCWERDAKLDLHYWEYCTRKILSQHSTKEAIIIPAPAGSGKSTWIEAFNQTMVELFCNEPDLSDNLVGITVVLQKVEDLNRLAEVLNIGTEEELPNMVALQALTESGKRMGFCKNQDIRSFEECNPSTCSFSNRCKILKFREQALTAPVVGLTQERFLMLRDSGNLNSVLYRVGKDGRPYPRRYLIFDEKFQMAPTQVLDKNVIDEASKELTRLIEKKGVSDQQVRYYQQQLEYQINRPYQQLRSKLRLEMNDRMEDIQVGCCDMKDTELVDRIRYEEFRNSVLDRNKKFATKHLRIAFTVMDKLYAGEPCLFSKVNGFAIASIQPPVVQYGQCQSLIFDATAKVDQDYAALTDVQWLDRMPNRKPCRINLNVYTHPNLSVSKRAMSAPWKIPMFSRLAADLISRTTGDVFLCTYQKQAETMKDALQEQMPSDDFNRVLLMESKGRTVLPYLGGTNGSNLFHNAETVIMMGFPRLNPRDYLIHTAAAYGPDCLYDAFKELMPEQLVSKDLSGLYSLPAMQTYITHHLAARLEQEIFRCAMRKPGFNGAIGIHLFCPPQHVLELLSQRLPGNITFIYHNDPPEHAELCKIRTRQYEGGPTLLAQLELFFQKWDGRPIRSSEIREHLGVGLDTWKSLAKDHRFTILLQEYHVERRGRGRNCIYISTQAGCA